jgi:glycosyltransferase involved in cell wall biosynthesis
VVVVPLRIGSGTRLKVLEALALGKAVVTTSVGCEGLEVRHQEHLLVADDPRTFAESVATLLRDPAAADALGRRGRALVESRYGWARSVGELERFHRSLFGAREAMDRPAAALGRR